jgi:hypothetical protein
LESETNKDKYDSLYLECRERKKEKKKKYHQIWFAFCTLALLIILHLAVDIVVLIKDNFKNECG